MPARKEYQPTAPDGKRKAPNITHTKLVDIGRKWLFRSYPVVITEIATIGESPDVLGFRGGYTTLIECKASRADFLADKQKYFRKTTEMGVGRLRYFLAPLGLIDVPELPDRWGLLETDGKRVWKTRSSDTFVENSMQEKAILVSTLRRIVHRREKCISISTYAYETQNRASLTIALDDDVVEIVESTEAA